MTGSDDFQKFCGLGLDRIQFYRIRIGLGLKNFTVRSSLLSCSIGLQVMELQKVVNLGPRKRSDRTKMR